MTAAADANIRRPEPTPADTPARPPFRRREAAAVAGLLVVHLGLLASCAVNKSVCYDEGPHLAAGLAYLRYGEFSIYNLSPPPLRMLAAVPVYLLAEPNIPLARPVLSVSPPPARGPTTRHSRTSTSRACTSWCWPGDSR
jgi:hypothetical protein